MTTQILGNVISISSFVLAAADYRSERFGFNAAPSLQTNIFPVGVPDL